MKKKSRKKEMNVRERKKEEEISQRLNDSSKVRKMKE